MGRSSSRLALLLIPLVFACFALSHSVRAVSPTPDGLYPGANVAEGGSGALHDLTTGTNNTAIGVQTLFSLTVGNQNTAVGAQALKNNNANENTAVGFQALAFNTDGRTNTATGWRALYKNTGGAHNVALGDSALGSNTTGNLNTAVGSALDSNTTGSSNTAVGFAALTRSTGSSNVALGEAAGNQLTTGDHNIYIGNLGDSIEFNTIRIGESSFPPFHRRTFIAGISGVAVSGAGVVVNDEGQLGVAASSARFKKDIKPMDKASEAILGLKPVSFHYKKDIDAAGISQFGLVAEEVEKVNPDLVVHDKEGKPFTVRYDAVNAMLLNEFLKEHRTVQEQQNEIDVLRAELKEQRALIQKVNDKVELAKPVPQTVLNNQ